MAIEIPHSGEPSDSSPEVVMSRLLKRYPGKTVVFVGDPVQVVFAGDSLAEAESYIRGSQYDRARCRIAQGPPTVDITLEELKEMDHRSNAGEGVPIDEVAARYKEVLGTE